LSSRIHKNSLKYQGETHVYKIIGPEGTAHKVGESARGLRVRDGASIRAEEQVRKLFRETGQAYEAEVIRKFGTKRDAREYETKLIKRYRKFFGETSLPGNKTNR